MGRDFWSGKVILITGGTGSFGQAFTKILLDEYHPKAIRIFSRGEFLQYEMSQKFSDARLRFFIGDVRDRERLHRAMYGVDIIIHAAALKQVPIVEYNPIEAIRTNIDGAINVIDAAIDNKVEKVIAISSDKAAEPCNLYGSTKLTMEKLFVQANVYGGKFSCVRYGNVIGSRGSVVPLFLKQKEAGTIKITSPEMTRFWLTLDQGVRFVINCIEKMRGGEIFVPKIPSMKIIEWLKVIAPDSKIEVIGIRPGEKIHETLITENESRHTKEFGKYFVIEPEFSFWGGLDGGKPLSEGFSYTSRENMSANRLCEQLVS